MDKTKDSHEYTKMCQFNLGFRDPGNPEVFLAFNRAQMYIHYDGNTVDVAKEAIRTLEEWIEQAKIHGF